jgi:hypothetical protein
MYTIKLPTLMSEGASPYSTFDVIINVEGNRSMIDLFWLYTVDDESPHFVEGVGGVTFKTCWWVATQAPIPSRWTDSWIELDGDDNQAAAEAAAWPLVDTMGWWCYLCWMWHIVTLEWGWAPLWATWITFKPPWRRTGMSFILKNHDRSTLLACHHTVMICDWPNIGWGGRDSGGHYAVALQRGTAHGGRRVMWCVLL